MEPRPKKWKRTPAETCQKRRAVSITVSVGGGMSSSGRATMGSWGRAPSGMQGQSRWWEVWERSPQKLTTLFFDNAISNHFWCMHDTNQFNMKWRKNQFGGRKVVGQATVLARWAHKVGERLPALHSRLRRQWLRYDTEEPNAQPCHPSPVIGILHDRFQCAALI